MTDIEEDFPSLNVWGEPLIPCSLQPLTGFFRDGCCNTHIEDGGSHTVCAKMTQEFLEYSRFKGNDLSTPHPESGFPGLKPGDYWCLCAPRWWQAYQQGMAPHVRLQACHQQALKWIPIEILRQFALDLN